MYIGNSHEYMQIHTLNSAYNEVAFNKKLAITKENLHTKYTPFTYNDVTLNEKPPMTKQNLHIFFFIIGRVECIQYPHITMSLGPYVPVMELQIQLSM